MVRILVRIGRCTPEHTGGPGSEDSTGHLRPFELLPETEERMGLVAAHAAEQDAVDAIALVDDHPEPSGPCIAADDVVLVDLERAPELVAELPHLAGNHGSRMPEIGSCTGDRGHDRRRIVAVDDHEPNDPILCRRPAGVGGAPIGAGVTESFDVPGHRAGHVEERPPPDVLSHREVEVCFTVHGDHPCGVFGPFEVPPRPVEMFPRPGEQGRGNRRRGVGVADLTARTSRQGASLRPDSGGIRPRPRPPRRQSRRSAWRRPPRCPCCRHPVRSSR